MSPDQEEPRRHGKKQDLESLLVFEGLGDSHPITRLISEVTTKQVALHTFQTWAGPQKVKSDLQVR